ncbi:MAG: WbqC family protein [Weeksellaceae bacterium]|jgi:hypothetical protein|nr:WbqC family protein [Weeksellaceae bacterium]MDX9704222.1 WbqC family protein [Weeksellaceae bacterium]
MIFPVFYFGPLSYFGKLIATENFSFEIHENFPKQTYRNRCHIQAANGKLRLVIPIAHDGSRKIKDIRISTDCNWQKEHFKSLVSAYKSSPYFEFYEEELAAVYEKKEKFLIDFNLNTLAFIQSKLKFELNFNLTENYQEIEEENDFRNYFNSKIEPEKNNFPSYMQVFDERFDFMPDLSILDILCNEGPKSTTYLRNLK